MRRRLIALLFVSSALAASGLVSSTRAAAETATSGGSDPRTATIDAGVHYYVGRWSGSHSNCSWDLFYGDTAVDHQQTPAPIRKVVAGVEYRLFSKECPGSADAIVWVGPSNPRRLVVDLTERIRDRLPAPALRSAPPANLAYVTVQNWIWTDTPWTEASVTAWVPTEGNGRVWATTTAAPRTLRLDPGDGSVPVECDGPGVEWSSDVPPSEESSCGHVFLHTSLTAPNGRSFRGSLSIDWDVEWISSTGEGGALEPITTTTPVAFTVGEIQAVVTN